jgi:CDP-4-dehydro-6-deoxyglucose reductase, E1|tara:strand:- start:10045 stop:11214 length:1170 start_codon:yes stop_codon:yes gene_type:complete
MYWPLMENTITFKDRLKMAKFVMTTGRFTNGPEVRKFEKQWSEWLGVNHSLYVSSGSTANSLIIESVKEYYGLKNGDKVLVPATTWMTNVAPVIQAGLQPIFCDINLRNFSFDVDELQYVADQHPDIKAVFVTHLIGLSAPLETIRSIFPDALILEDVCESHGVQGPHGEKRGSNSIASSFSFYFGHHMTTIEGGMVCTNNTELYEVMRLKRSHGMAREGSPGFFDEYKKANPDIDPAFLFMTDGFNFRNHEICAVLGQAQLKRLDKNIEIRRENYQYYYDTLLYPSLSNYMIPEYQIHNSSFSFPIIPIGSNVKLLKTLLRKNEIEYRPIISGNLLRHPAFKKYSLCTKREKSNVDYLHENGVYVGNSQFVKHKQIDKLKTIMEEVAG